MKIFSLLHFYIKLVYSVWKKDGISGVRDHAICTIKVSKQRLFPQKKFPQKDIVFISECPGASAMYRCENTAEGFNFLGKSTAIYPANGIVWEKCVKSGDIFILHRVMYTDIRAEAIRKAQKLGKKFIYDTDDLIFNLDKLQTLEKLPKSQYDFMKKEFTRAQQMLKNCDYSFGSTNKLTEELEKISGKKSFLVPNVANEEVQKTCEKLLEKTDVGQSQGLPLSNSIIIGYSSGTRTHDDDFLGIAKPLQKTLENLPETKLAIIGHLNLPENLERFFQENPTRIVRHGHTKYENMLKIMSGWDVNLAPLENLEFNEAKSCIKFLEAGILGVPTVAQDMGDFSENIISGKNSLLCKSSEDWQNSLEKLMVDKEFREKLGNEAREFVLRKKTTKVQQKNLAKILAEIS